MAKHFIITDEARRILRGFSDDFEQPDESAFCICEDGGRHFELNGVVNPSLMDEQGRYRYKLVDGTVIERTPEELAADVLPQPAPSQVEINAANIDYLAMMTGVEI